MYFLDLTLSTPQENLALDEALLDMCEAGFQGEILRFWEPRLWFVVLGYSNHGKKEVYNSKCRKETIPILRRPSGGGTVLQGPGCLNYALILNIRRHKWLRTVQTANAAILNRIRQALQPLTPQKIRLQGTTDLTIMDQKFSGNAQRRKLHSVLFHGTLLTQFNANLVQKFLPFPSKSPDYRQGRSHLDFLANFPAGSQRIKAALKYSWGAKMPLKKIPLDRVAVLNREKYSQQNWNMKF